MRASRLLSLLILLQLRGRLSAEALAREFEVSVRTIYRDIEHLAAAGVPVYAERGRSGGFTLLDGFKTRLTGLTAGEADTLGLMGAAQAAVELGFGDEAASARLKLLASLPPDVGAGASRVSMRFHLDPTPWYGRRRTPEALPALARAVWLDRPIRIRYESWKGIVERRIEPLGLVLKAGEWYVVGLVEGSRRTYRAAAIERIEMLEGGIRRPSDFDLARHWAASVEEFEQALRGNTARVRLSTAGYRLLRDVNPFAAEAIEATFAARAGDEWIETELPVEDGPHAVRELLRLGAEVEVIAPVALREAIAATARRIAARHHDAPSCDGA